jgi:GT2 family glycosyltransferase/glycosyltransferase involved in cell wall biosynthesis
MVSVLIVTHNSAACLERCLASVLAQQDVALEIVIIDNASTDSTREILARFGDRALIAYNRTNRGFAAGQNQALSLARGEWFLVLNPDVILDRRFVAELLAAARRDRKVGSVCGKLLRWKPGAQVEKSREIDCTGMYFLPNLRHLDRGAEQLDSGQFDREEYCFGASGAAALYHRTMVDDVAVRGEFFDEAFFAYREDADLAWRAQLLGWRCIYTPRAVGWHVRRVTPDRRGQLPLAINWHSVKNRFLMRAKNAARPVLRRTFWPVLWRDAMVVGYALFANPRLLSALGQVWRERHATAAKRAVIQKRRRVTDEELLHWFSGSPGGIPLDDKPSNFTSLKIAIVGTRGIPARYGGFETLADELAKQLTSSGHQVTVYCRKAFVRTDDIVDPRIRRVVLPSLSRKNLDTLINGAIAALHVACSDADAVLFCNVANSPWVWVPRMLGKPVALNVDGLDRTRRKWSWFARVYLHFCEMLSVVTPSRIITDAKVIQRYFRERYGKDSVVIGYGARAPKYPPQSPLDLPSHRYLLYVSRFEKENHPEMVIEAYRQVETDWPLVVVGSNAYDPGYLERLRAMADARVVFPGPVYGDGYWALQQHAGIYVFSGEVGGIHPALVEAMSARNAVLYLDTDANRETAADSGLPFRDAQELAAKMAYLIAHPETRSDLARRAEKRVQALYRWEHIAAQYEDLFLEMVGTEPRPSAAEASQRKAA